MLPKANSKKGITIEYFTDPLCCWSWAFNAQRMELCNALGDTVTWHLRMGGLLPSWNNFHDESNSINRPAQMGPVWMHAGQIANLPICHQIWMTDPPSSSYPACIAVKCGQLQSEDLGYAILKKLHNACMERGKNIAKQEVIFAEVEAISTSHPLFDFKKFKSDYLNGKGKELFRADLDYVNSYRINRFPTLVVKSAGKKSIMIAGYRPYTEILKALESFQL